MDTRVPDCRSGEEILKAYSAVCGLHGKVDRIWLFCHQDNPAETLCMVEMDTGAKNAAAAAGGWAYAKTVCIRHALCPEFRCRRRPEGKMTVRSCDECRLPPDEGSAANGATRAIID